MLFNTVQFAIFFLCVWGLHRAAPASWRNGILLGASLFFYFCWVPAYLALLILEAAVNYGCLRAMATRRWRRGALLLSLMTSLGTLALFKYGDFLIHDVGAVLGAGAVGLHWVLPLGISFYTFQMVALAVDTYRGEIAPVGRFREYLLFIAFFPQLVAGPIVRGSELLPQLAIGGAPSSEKSRRGAWLLASGAIKKMVVADFLLAPFVSLAFDQPNGATAPIRWVGLYSFAFQIYFDFSGYTDMARGMALLLGFELPRNFLEPYLSRNPAEFWRRWHITLSRWLRDYLYIPLGGNRRGAARIAANLMITMALGGLWHGAGWNFIIWGALHGVLLVGHRLVRGRRGRENWQRPVRLAEVGSIFLLFNAVTLLWVFFRCATPSAAGDYLTTLWAGDFSGAWPIGQLGLVLICGASQFVERGIRERAPRWRASLSGRWGGVLEGAAFGSVWALAFWVGGAGEAFIYFQF